MQIKFKDECNMRPEKQCQKFTREDDMDNKYYTMPPLKNGTQFLKINNTEFIKCK